MIKYSSFYKILFFIVFGALFQTCVDPLGFDTRHEDHILVIDGKVNLNDSVHTVSLTRTDYVGRSAKFPPEQGAMLTLMENDKPVVSFLETEPGIYKAIDFKPTVGYRYSIDIQLQNGDHYASQPEAMPSPVPIDSAYFTFDRKRSLTIFSDTQIPTDGDTPYLRWHIQHVYQHSDIICGPLDNIGVCYYELERKGDNQNLILLDGGELQRGAQLAFPVVKVGITDSIFGEITYFTVYQESLPEATFHYWEKVNTLLTQTGSIFDAPPGQVRGNIFKVDDPNAPVLGIFYPTSEDYARIKTLPSDFLPLNINPYCGIPGIPPNPFPYPDCCFCKFGIPKPDYWK